MAIIEDIERLHIDATALVKHYCENNEPGVPGWQWKKAKLIKMHIERVEQAIAQIRWDFEQ